MPGEKPAPPLSETLFRRRFKNQKRRSGCCQISFSPSRRRQSPGGNFPSL